MKLASIQIIADIRPIPGADRIEAATILGYQTVIKKGEFKVGDPCVWHEPDTIVPERPEYEFLRRQKFRLKVTRFKGQVSQGLALPVSILKTNNYVVGDDLTEVIGIQKYEKPIPANLAGQVKGNFPSGITKTDEPNLRSCPDALTEFQGKRCVITQKVDGTSGTYYLRDGNFGVCSRNLELLEDASNTFWEMASKYHIREALEKLGGNFALQGEIHGAGIQSNHMKLKCADFSAFNLFNITTHRYAGHNELMEFCSTAGIPMVKVVWEGEFRFTLEELIELSNKQDYLPDMPAEGIVIRPIEESRSLVLPSGRLSAKVLSERYALKYGE